MRLGRLVRARRGVLALDLLPVAREQRMSPDTWAKVEDGSPVKRASVYGRIERVLGWPAGSITAYLDGGPEPAPGDDLVLYEPDPGSGIQAGVTPEMAAKLARLGDRGLAFLEAALEAALALDTQSDGTGQP